MNQQHQSSFFRFPRHVRNKIYDEAIRSSSPCLYVLLPPSGGHMLSPCLYAPDHKVLRKDTLTQADQEDGWQAVKQEMNDYSLAIERNGHLRCRKDKAVRILEYEHNGWRPWTQVNVPLACKRMYAEAIPYFGSLSFSEPMDLLQFLRATPFPPHHRVERIEVYWPVFGDYSPENLMPEMDADLSELCGRVAAMRNLKSFKIIIDSRGGGEVYHCLTPARLAAFRQVRVEDFEVQVRDLEVDQKEISLPAGPERTFTFREVREPAWVYGKYEFWERAEEAAEAAGNKDQLLKSRLEAFDYVCEKYARPIQRE